MRYIAFLTKSKKNGVSKRNQNALLKGEKRKGVV
jgi:hypothetical protein